jgi:hypothetical protein
MSELFTLDTLQEFWAKRPKGAKLQYAPARNNWITTKGDPSIGDCSEIWRWEPQSKPIDLYPLIGSDVLCEASRGVGFTVLGFLNRIASDGMFMFRDGSEWPRCRPVMNKWMAVDKDMFRPEGLDSTVVYVGGRVSEIKLVKFTGLKEGYHWPWDDK